MTQARSTRRQFLSRSATAAAATLAVPTILPNLYAQGSANDRVTLAAIGVGGVVRISLRKQPDWDKWSLAAMSNAATRRTLLNG